MPHCTCPGAGNAGDIDIAILMQAQRSSQLAREQLRAALIAGQCCQCIEQRDIAEHGTVVGFQPPESEQVFRAHTVVRFDFMQQPIMFFQQLAAAFDTLVGDTLVDVLPEGMEEFRLRVVGGDDLRARLNGREYAVDNVRFDARRTHL